MKWKASALALVAMFALVGPAVAQTTSITIDDTTYTMPDSIAESIKAHAAEEWPGDFSMQRYTIEREVKAFFWIGEWIRETTIPRATMEQIYGKAARDWPDQYTMQQYTIERQVEAYNEIQ